MKKNKMYLYRFLRPIFTFMFNVYYNPTVINKEAIPKNESAVLAGNHKHAFDPILVDTCTKRVVYALAKKALHDGKFGFFFRAVGTIPVDTKNKNNKGSLNTAVEYLKDNSLLYVSPEGTRNRTDNLLLPFKPGAVVMAQRADCKIIPYAITGDYKFRSKNLKIIYGSPISVANMTVEEATELLFNNIKNLLLNHKEAR